MCPDSTDPSLWVDVAVATALGASDAWLGAMPPENDDDFMAAGKLLSFLFSFNASLDMSS